MKYRYVKLLKYPLLSLLLMSSQCVVPVNDRQNRKEEINNTAQSLGEYLMWKKVEDTKQQIDETYDRLFALQDSIDQAMYNSNTVADMFMASIAQELNSIKHLHEKPEAYIREYHLDQVDKQLQHLYSQKDVEGAAKGLADILFYTKAIRAEQSKIQQSLAKRHQFQSEFAEFSSKRAMQSAQIYRSWAELYRHKGVELSERLQTNKAFAMSDYERIRLQALAQKYVVMSYEFIEKSDSLLLAHTAKRGLQYSQEQLLAQYLFTKQLFE